MWADPAGSDCSLLFQTNSKFLPTITVLCERKIKTYLTAENGFAYKRLCYIYICISYIFIYKTTHVWVNLLVAASLFSPWVWQSWLIINSVFIHSKPPHLIGGCNLCALLSFPAAYAQSGDSDNHTQNSSEAPSRCLQRCFCPPR